MTQTKERLLAIVLVTGTALGCGVSPAARFYMLAPTSEATDAPKVDYAIAVGPVSIPSAVDRPQFVVQVAPNRVEIDEFSRWVAPLDEAIARAIAANLATLLGTPDVSAAPLATSGSTFRVAVDVQRFDSLLGESVALDAAWTVRHESLKEPYAGRTRARETAADDGYDALAAAHSRALGSVSTEIAAAIRAIASRAR
jgi:uncharacterized lipoprotein YmbA